jgi:thiosulfate/3-mercaptopyruvate sulfurtransferase
MPAPSPLVDVAWLAAHAGDPRVRVLDVRWYLGPRRGADEYTRGHLPGAAFVDVDRELASPPSSGPGRHPLPTKEAFVRTLSRLGVGRDTLVVAYDDAGGAIAARLWWLLRHFGHGGGRVLDGGITAWTGAGHPLSTDVPVIAPAEPLDLASGPAGDVIDRTGVDALRRELGAGHAPGNAVILDARAPDRYEGKVEPIDARPGHVPGARSAPFAGNLAPGGVFLDREALADRYGRLGALDAARVVCYCGSGVTACHDLLALALLGREDAMLYEGSWSDWASDPSLPAALGPEPGG